MLDLCNASAACSLHKGSIWTLQHTEQAQLAFEGHRHEAAEEVSGVQSLHEHIVADHELVIGARQKCLTLPQLVSQKVMQDRSYFLHTRNSVSAG